MCVVLSRDVIQVHVPANIVLVLYTEHEKKRNLFNQSDITMVPGSTIVPIIIALAVPVDSKTI
jgi:hypothetical protein